MKNYLIRFKNDIDKLIMEYNYDSNIAHLMYIIIPAFMIKYKNREKLIMDTFKNTPIIISNKDSKNINAFYTSILKRDNDKVYTTKYVIINNYSKLSLVNLLDSLIHEYNHAINSYLKEIEIIDNIIYVRTGLTHIKYNYDSLKCIEKEKSYILEEIINTKQTENVIDIIKNYKDTDFDMINNVIYAINNETSKHYESRAYYLETKALMNLLSNKTFIYTLENLRIEGNIADIEVWFDEIMGNKNSYQNLIYKLNKLVILEEKLEYTKYFKGIIIGKIKSLVKDIDYMASIFNKNSNNR